MLAFYDCTGATAPFNTISSTIPLKTVAKLASRPRASSPKYFAPRRDYKALVGVTRVATIRRVVEVQKSPEYLGEHRCPHLEQLDDL